MILLFLPIFLHGAFSNRDYYVKLLAGILRGSS